MANGSYTKIVKMVAPGNGETEIVLVSASGYSQVIAAANYSDLLPPAEKVEKDYTYGFAGELVGTLVGGSGIDPADVVDAQYVVAGHDNYVGGDHGSYPTTATSQAAQLATDQAAVLASAAWIVSGHSILGQAGTFDLSVYTLKSSVVGASYVLTGHSNYTGGAAGTFVAPTAAQMIHGQSCGVAGAIAGTQYVPTAANTNYGINTGTTTGTLTLSFDGSSKPFPDSTVVNELLARLNASGIKGGSLNLAMDNAAPLVTPGPRVVSGATGDAAFLNGTYDFDSFAEGHPVWKKSDAYFYHTMSRFECGALHEGNGNDVFTGDPGYCSVGASLGGNGDGAFAGQSIAVAAGAGDNLFDLANAKGWTVVLGNFWY